MAKWKQFGPYKIKDQEEVLTDLIEAMFLVIDKKLPLYLLFASAEWQSAAALLSHSLPALTPAFAAVTGDVWGAHDDPRAGEEV